MESTQLASILFSVVSSLAFATVAVVIARRDVSAPMRGANRAFVVWWGGLACSTVLAGFETSLAVLGYTPVALFQATALLRIVFVCIALWGLLHYLLVLITGWRGLAWPLGILYAALAVYLAWDIQSANPDHVALGNWTATLQPATPPQGAELVLLLALVVGPQFLAAIAYLTLYFRVDDRMAKRRILIVSLSIIIWFGSAILVAVGGGGQSDRWQLASRLLGLAAAAAILYAYVGLVPRDGTPAGEDDEQGPEAESTTSPPQQMRSLHPPSVV